MDSLSYDPLLGIVKQHLEKRSKSAPSGARKQLVEQLALAHFGIGRLQIKACVMNNPKISVG